MGVGGYHEVLGARLRHHRQATGMTLESVSRRSGVSFGFVCEIERGTKRAGSETLGIICRSLGLPLSTLLRETADELELMEMEVPLGAAA